MRFLTLILFLSVAVGATQIFYRPLEQVLTKDTPVILARVQGRKIETSESTLSVKVEISEIRPVHLEVPLTSMLTYSHSLLLERKVNGQTVRLSPIRDGSGIETRLETGQSYYFLLDAKGDIILRAELESSGPAIRAILQGFTSDP